MFQPNFRTGPVLKMGSLALLTLAMVLLPTALRADTLTYDVTSTDTFQTNIGNLTGTFTVDFSTKHATATVFVDGETFTCTNEALFTPGGNSSLEGFQAFGPGGSFVLLAWSILPADPNPLIFSTVSGCVGCPGGGGTDLFSTGDTATIPEPSTAVLLIPGLAIALPFARRRLAKN